MINFQIHFDLKRLIYGHKCEKGSMEVIFRGSFAYLIESFILYIFDTNLLVCTIQMMFQI